MPVCAGFAIFKWDAAINPPEADMAALSEDLLMFDPNFELNRYA